MLTALNGILLKDREFIENILQFRREYVINYSWDDVVAYLAATVKQKRL